MKHVLRTLLIAAASIVVFNGNGQAQDSSMTLDHFNGGSLAMEFFMTNWHMSGTGQKASALAGLPCTFNPNVEDIFNNPAGIGYMRDAGLMLDYAAPFPLAIDKILGLKDQVQDAETESFEDSFDNLPADFDSRKTEIGDVTAGQRGSFTGLAVALPLRYVNLGFGVANPFNFELNVKGLGIEVTAVTQVGPLPLKSALAIDMALDINFRTQMTTIGIGRELGAGFAAGIALDKYDASFGITADLVPQGIISTNSPFYINADDSTTFNQSVRGDLSGGGLGTRIGLSYHAPKVFSLDLVYTAAPTLSLDGSLVTIQNFYPLFSGVGLDEDYMSSPEFPSNPLGVKESDTTTYDGMIMNLPSSFAVGIGLHGGTVGFGIGYKKYFNELSFELPDGVKQGLKYGSDISLALDARYFRIGLGLVTLDVVGEVPESTKSVIDLKPVVDSLSLPFLAIPKFSIGFSFPVGSAVDVNTVLLAMPPLGVLKTTLTYNWDMKALEQRAKRVDPMELFDNAEQLFDTGKYWEAAFAFGSLAAMYPKFSKVNIARFQVGESFFNAGYAAAAGEAYADFMTRYADDPSVETVMLRQGQLLYRNGDYDKVAARHVQMLKDFPSSKLVEELAYLAGQGLLRQGKHKDAAGFLAQVSPECGSFKFAQYSLGQCAIYAEDGKGAVAALKKVFAKPAKTPAEKALDDRARLALGHLLYELTDFAGAITEYKAVSDTTGAGFERALVGRAWARVKLKEYDKVAGVVEKLLARFPDGAYAAEANLLLGYCRSLEKKYEEAGGCYKKSIDICTKPTGIRKTQIEPLRIEKEKAVETARTGLAGTVAPTFKLALTIPGDQRDVRAKALQQEVVLKTAVLEKALKVLDSFNGTVRQMAWNETLLHDAKAALPTAEHMKQETDKAKADKEYEKKLKTLEQQMQNKLKQQDR